MVAYPGEGGTITAYRAALETGASKPLIVILHEWWGLTHHIKTVAHRFARAGYVAVAPDLYSRLGHAVTSNPAGAGELMASLRQDDGLKDLQTTLTYLTRDPGTDASQTGIVGFSMGGTFAPMLSCTTSDLGAAVSFYGWVPNPDNPLQHLCCPLLYIYGEQEEAVPQTDVQRLAGAFKKYNKTGEIQSYPGAGHSFFRDTDDRVYRPQAAGEAWKRTLAFLQQHLS